MKFLLSIIFFFIGVTLLQAEILELVSLGGKKIKAKVVSKDSDSVRIRMVGKSKIFQVSLIKFDATSRRKIRETDIWSESLELVIDVNKSGSDVNKVFGSGEFTSYSKEREETLSGKILIRNEDSELELKGGQISFAYIVKGHRRGHFRMLGKQRHHVRNLGPRAEAQISLAQARNHYGKGKDNFVGNGGRYVGYMMVFHNKGKVIAHKCIPETYEAYLPELIKLTEKLEPARQHRGNFFPMSGGKEDAEEYRRP